MSQRNSTRARRICFDAHKIMDAKGKVKLPCHVCKAEMDPVRDQWRADHIRRHAEGGEDTAENLHPICLHCDKEKAPRDASEVAKGKRTSDRYYGIKQSKGSPMQGSRASGWKRKMDGSVVKR